ncbi:MAG TPA: carboxypeptidase M32, partial [Spirochaetia bacterium]|nr:carboxypeptidase M32 [Spirochaetia bacterium]
MEEQLNRLKVLDRDIQVLTHAIAVLEWDQETYMPELGIEERAEQLALLKGILHQNITSSEIGELLDRLGADTNNPEGNRSLGIRDRAIIREVFRRYKINTNLPASLIKRLARQTSITQSRWVQAKNQSDFGLFAPYLEQLLSLILEKAEKLGYKESLYDPLLDEYEPWMKTSELEAILLPLQDQLIRILEQIIHSNRTIDSSVMGRSLSLKIQRDFNTELLLSMGYDFKKGRLDESAHPFTTTLGRADIRLTTRYKSDRFASSIFSTIHEGGHGLYEMGFDEELQWTVLA